MAGQPDFDRWVFQLLAGLAGMATLLGVGLVVVAPHEKGVWKVIPFFGKRLPRDACSFVLYLVDLGGLPLILIHHPLLCLIR